MSVHILGIRRQRTIGGVEVAAGEDVCGGESGGGLATVEEEDLVGRGDEDYGGGGRGGRRVFGGGVFADFEFGGLFGCHAGGMESKGEGLSTMLSRLREESRRGRQGDSIVAVSLGQSERRGSRTEGVYRQ